VPEAVESAGARETGGVAVAEKDLFQELKDALQDFKDFLHPKVATLKPAIQALAALIPQINDVLTQLANLLGQLKTEIQNLDISGIPGVGDVAEFTGKAKTALEAARNHLTEQAGDIEGVIDVIDVVSSLPSLDQVKGEIISLLDDLIADVNQLKS
jgi:ABC-type transporter Mla subunit MlaD